MKFLNGVLHNFWWKVLSLLLSVALWLAFVGESEVVGSVVAAVQYHNLPKDIEISSDLTDRLYLKVRGPASRLTAPSLAQTSIVLDLSSVSSPGEHTFTLDQSNVSLPPGVTLTRVVPSQVRLRFEKHVTREVPVQVRYAGPPPAGYRVAGQDAFPEKVRVSGPESRVEQITSAQTDAIDLSSTVSNGEFRTSVFISEPQVRLESSDIIAVHVRLEKIRTSKD
jgi:YbbR domain-containing protein